MLSLCVGIMDEFLFVFRQIAVVVQVGVHFLTKFRWKCEAKGVEEVWLQFAVVVRLKGLRLAPLGSRHFGHYLHTCA